MKLSKFVELCEEHELGPRSFFNKEYHSLELFEHTGPIEVVDTFGGEGKGDSAHVVIHLKDHDVYFKHCAYYNSYDGFDFSFYNWEKVTPIEKTIIIYE